jgi:hypothetical protein
MKSVAHDYCICDHKSHMVVLREDGTIDTPDHPEAVAQGRRMSAFARMGRPVEIQGCATLAALVYGAEIVCSHWASNDPSTAPPAWRRALDAFRTNRVVSFAMVAAQAKKATADEASLSRLMVELGRCSWYRGQRMDLTTGLSAAEVRDWGDVGFVGERLDAQLRIPLQKHWLDLAGNGRIVYTNKLIVGDSPDDPRVVYAVHRDTESEYPKLRVGAFRRDTRMERLDPA